MSEYFRWLTFGLRAKKAILDFPKVNANGEIPLRLSLSLIFHLRGKTSKEIGNRMEWAQNPKRENINPAFLSVSIFKGNRSKLQSWVINILILSRCAKFLSPSLRCRMHVGITPKVQNSSIFPSESEACLYPSVRFPPLSVPDLSASIIGNNPDLATEATLAARGSWGDE